MGSYLLSAIVTQSPDRTPSDVDSDGRAEVSKLDCGSLLEDSATSPSHRPRATEQSA